ncbi:HAD family hydrolase [Curtobacterium caseinilyticum]|uniref:HAD family hydrolase n=1 Tax=Curtobacterium caseinilyticum TaxID=3055137 RepID=A0ABT7TLG5_9MICO|nr:HAD family hydrolase [Curtobacterium caseinilyticum]MDM7890426.1 HAD family hydrolase [Curtobacterium caseinilyticum]
MTNGVRAVVFDLDGTLIDHAGASAHAVEDFLRQVGVAATPALLDTWAEAEERHLERWRRGEVDFAEQRRARLVEVLPVAGIRPPRDLRELDLLFGRYLAAYRAAWRPFVGSAALLREIRDSGRAIGVLTNGTEEQQRDKLVTTGLADLVDVVCTSERIGATKPDRRAFERVADELGVPTGVCLFVGDDPHRDVDGARAAGMRAVLVDPARDGDGGVRSLVLSALHGESGSDPR